MIRQQLKNLLGAGFLALCLGTVAAVAGTPPDARNDPEAFMEFAIAQACRSPPPAGAQAGAELARRFGGAQLLEARVFDFRGLPGRAQFRLLLADGDEVRVSRLFPMGRLRRVTVDYYRGFPKGPPRPVMSAALNAGCGVLRAARIDYDRQGRAETLLNLGQDLKQVLSRQPLNPPVPAGRDPGGILVAHVDTGVNYLLEGVSARLARDTRGMPLGFDYWDMDNRPFDLDTGRSPFFPLHHGTAVASIILREAPRARLVPYRYPRPDMSRLEALVADADDQGVVIVNMAMGSNKRSDWEALARAAGERAHILFVISAGNDGRDIDERPVFPAALDLENFLVVTSADNFGRLAEGSNWGRSHVDIMVPGERVPVTDHRGADGKASGSSFAVPRITALAARLLAKHPDWKAKELKRAIVARARLSRHYEVLPVRYGWIPDPTDDF
ncbi:MAG: S8 family serine peptidase [Proteobacteria bacterium]|nr:S8 family serine peptidase [Pseudomonadota bacterium]MDA1021914.1 S8 family serine peptidase [Pseudomonadota bacterium]